VDHETVTYDFADSDDAQRRTVELLLIGAEIPFGWEGETDLVVPQTAEAMVDQMLEDVENVPADTLFSELDTPETGPWPHADPPLATIRQRALARLVDSVVTAVAASLVLTLVAQSRFTPGDNLEPSPLLWWSGWLLFFAYDVVLTSVWGQTIGKRVVRIRVAGPDGETPGWGRAVRRSLLPSALAFVPHVGWLLAAAAILRAAFVADRRGFHDLVAGTTVVHAEPRKVNHARWEMSG
jgi:uncharacterized RDD family membrane protein YckC